MYIVVETFLAGSEASNTRIRAFVEELRASVFDGELADTDLALLHDSMQRARKPREH